MKAGELPICSDCQGPLDPEPEQIIQDVVLMERKKHITHKIVPFDPTKITELALENRPKKTKKVRKQIEVIKIEGKPWIGEDVMWFRRESVGD